MNQTDGDKILANAKQSHYQRQHMIDQPPRPSSGGFQSFIRWFKKTEHRRHKRQASIKYRQDASKGRNLSEPLRSNKRYDSSDTLSPPSSPNLSYSDYSSSCDSVFSTATTGFAFIQPTYETATGPASGIRTIDKSIVAGPYTDSYRRRLKQIEQARKYDQKYKLTLRKKYNLYDTSTLKSEDLGETSQETGRSQYTDRSLPNPKEHETSGVSEETSSESSRKNRRTVSDSSKDKKAGAFSHVRGKRKAPPPPIQINKEDADTSIASSSGYYTGTLSPPSTLGRREKRKAPQPPPQSPFSTALSETISATSLLEDKEIRAIIEGSPFNRSDSEQFAEMNKTKLARDQFFAKDDQNVAAGLTEAQKQQLIDNVVKSQNSEQSTPTNSSSNVPELLENNVLRLEKGLLKYTKPETGRLSVECENSHTNGHNGQAAPSSPISPRPWYKRPLSSNKESTIPFKRDIILKTIDKRKNKSKKSEKADLPETGFFRNSLLDGGNGGGTNRFGFFSRLHEKTDDMKKREKEEKRRSGIGIPNISELDREAAEIVQKELMSAKTRINEENNKYFKTSPEQLMLRTQMFGIQQNTDDDDIAEGEVEAKPQRRKSTKELISKFEATSSQTNKVTVNSSFVGRTDLFTDQKNGMTSPTKNRNDNNYKATTSQLSPPPVKLDNIFNFDLKSDINNRLVGGAPVVATDDDNDDNDTAAADVVFTACNKLYQPPVKQMVMTEPPTTIISDRTKTTGNENCLELTKNNDSQKSERKAEVVNSSKTCVKNDKNNIHGLWSCPYCTLENPNWRIICEVCEKMKPYDMKKYFLGEKTAEMEKESGIPRPIVGASQAKPMTQQSDWEKKTERVLKYFKPRSSSGSALSKSASETSVNKNAMKPPTDRHVGSPKVEKRQFHFFRNSPDKSRNSSSNTNTIREEEPATLKSSVLVATVAAVFEPATVVVNTSSTPNLDEIRTARLAKFSTSSTPSDEKIEIEPKSESPIMLFKSVRKSKTPKSESPKPSNKQQETSFSKLRVSPTFISKEHEQKAAILANDPKALEKEKEILREKIRAMNAKAFAEKYPVAKQPELVSETPQETRDDPTKLGAIKKVFTKKPYEVPEIPLYSEIDSKFKTRSHKVSSSAQTQGILRKNDYEKLPTASQRKTSRENIYANYPNAETHQTTSVVSNHVRFSEKEKATLVEISEQLQSQKGVDDFKATLQTSENNTNTLAINKLLRNLENAILDGEHEQAAELAMDLAKMKVSLSVTRQKERPISAATEIVLENQIIVDLFVEDSKSQKGPLPLTVSPLITVRNLKLKVEKDFDIPVTVQRWILNNQLASDDSKTLLDFGVRENKSIIYLYILAASDDKIVELKEVNNAESNSKSVFSKLEANILNISDSDNDDDQNDKIEESGAAALPTPVVKENGVASAGWKCSICTLLNPFHRPDCLACSKPRPGDLNGLDDFKDDFPEELKRFLEEDNSYTAIIKTREPKNDLNRITTNRKSTDIFNIPFMSVEKKKTTTTSETEMPALESATNSMDTLASTSKLRPQAEQKLVVNTVFTSSPNITRSKYRGVYNFNPSTKSYELSKAVEIRKSPEHAPIIRNAVLKPTAEPPLLVMPFVTQSTKKVNLPQHRTRPDKRPAPKPPTAAQKSHYLELLNLDNSDAVKNFEPFECPVCFLDYDVGQGVILRDCLHTFCRECLGNTVQYSEEPVIKCPYMDSDYSCDSVLQEREIKSLVSREVYDQHLAKSVRQAEHEIQNTFHCKTPNCDNWCIYEDNVNQFKCPVCKIVNCLLCRAVHDGLNCKQYQDRLEKDCDNDADAKRTKEILNEMVEKGDALACPTCHVVMMKKWGCDWIKCSMCKTEICWVTRGPRWGPGGKGDTTGGCKCGENGKKCHPKCNYCH